jgi:hypothetical protein
MSQFCQEKMTSALSGGSFMFTVWIFYFEFDCRNTFFDKLDIYTLQIWLAAILENKLSAITGTPDLMAGLSQNFNPTCRCI